MGVPQIDERMEGWLYLIRSNRIGLQYSQKRYFILEDHCLKSFKAKPMSKSEDSVRSAAVDACIRVNDNGRVSINRKVLFIFTLHNTSNHSDYLKLGASCPEEAARWIHSFQESALKECPNPADNILASSKRKWQYLRLTRSKETGHSRTSSVDWTLYSSMHKDPPTSDVIAPSPWTIFGCENGLRLFKEAKDRDFRGKNWDDHPAIMAVGVVDGTPEAIFRTLMSLGSSRSEWDFCLSRGNVVEHLDGHTDIIHKQLNRDWLPWGMKRRDLLLRRYWRREDDGTYGGGYVVSPVNKGKQSVVKHMLAIDWKFWKSYVRTSSARSITIRMLGRVAEFSEAQGGNTLISLFAALRELFKAKLEKHHSTDFSSGELTRDIGLALIVKEDIKAEVKTKFENRNSDEEDFQEDRVEKSPSNTASIGELNDTSDEFFDVAEPSDFNHSENEWSDMSTEMHSQDQRQPKLSTTANFVRKLHDLAVQKKGYMDLAREDSITWHVYGSTLPKDPSCNLAGSWTTADPSTFLIRGDNYLQDQQKVPLLVIIAENLNFETIKAKGTLMQMVGADWLRSDKREDDLGSRSESIVQKYAAQGGPEFFFIVNIQVPGSTTYNLALYYMMSTPVEENPSLKSFINGDDAYRNSRFKLIPYISKGSWIVKQSVGKKACLVGQALQMNYFRGKNYLELGIDIGSSTVARGVVSLVLGYLNNLVIEMAFLIQGNTQEELPEFLLGTCRLNHLDVSKSVLTKP
ncbi:hypothetical protein GIB67_031028 [Kingdonia uniflora]|uniref:Uncharacterized protein n=1 Tax=Kingdonia uniflora TaxID=39325 RepID=A0A7J7NGU2_9MAGN|nr:hypothetical protein GIB67_031028 [Kingdonia uniflora]